MTKRAFSIILLLLITSSIITFLPVKATGARTLVVPDSYPSISSAIANATDGDTVYVKRGTYTEYQLTITKSIRLVGEGSQSTTLNLQSKRNVGEPLYWYLPDLFPIPVWYSRAMFVHTDNFELSGFKITTTGGDINITGNNNRIKDNSIAASLTIIGNHNDITGNTFSESPTVKRLYDYNIAGSHCNFTLNEINCGDVNFAGTYDVISFNNVTGSFSSVSDDCFYYKNLFKESGEFKVNGNNNIICRNVLDHYGSGLVLVGFGNRALLNNITYCRIGIAPSPDSYMYANYVAYNEWTINARNSILNPNGNLSFLTHNNFVDNRYYQMWTFAMSNDTDYLDNGKEGNYWSTYQGLDSNNDGIGDSPFYLDSTHLDQYPLMSPYNLSAIEELVPDWLVMPSVSLINPLNTTFPIANVTLNFTLNKQVSWLGYSLDGQDNATITGNLTLTNLSTGPHNITVYAKDKYGNTASSETITFTITPPSEFASILVVIICAITIAAIIVCVYVYRRKKKK
ncbi:MAG: hypothetical protein NWE96_07655 [Candidatus Bathyarchaeota archaeon]|nr:hypothetical protein [Candidatus Bathyarchaeota archaeon]